MLLTLTAEMEQATDLGYLLHKNPGRVHPFDLPFGRATVFYPEASERRCTAGLLVDVSGRIASIPRRRLTGGSPDDKSIPGESIADCPPHFSASRA
jgi:hypothetical protein